MGGQFEATTVSSRPHFRRRFAPFCQTRCVDMVWSLGKRRPVGEQDAVALAGEKHRKRGAGTPRPHNDRIVHGAAPVDQPGG